jgi:hypothetical protein
MSKYKTGEYPLVSIQTFIEATRDSGYKSTAAALSELVDNSFEAEAATVSVCLSEDADGKCITVTDDGTGMTPQTMQLALQFGGSTRFNSRKGTGRYGMGLPNGSVSQARRVDVYSWTDPGKIWTSYLDVDEIAAGRVSSVPVPTQFKPHTGDDSPSSPTGTVVVLTKCDRLDFRTQKTQAKYLHLEFGRTFRHQLYSGKKLLINGERVKPIDPLFLRSGNNLTGAESYGPTLRYDVAGPGGTASQISVRFAVLPIETWSALSNEEKNTCRISKGAGVSIVRGGRDIDCGWYFMGSKRKENYDDWWRCEISFSPELDELFGVTHTKQKVYPTEMLESILTPDLERIARELNSLVRRRYLAVREESVELRSTTVAERKDALMVPVVLRGRSAHSYPRPRGRITQLGYRIDEQVLEDVSFYRPSLVHERLTLTLNRDHNFYQKIYKPLAATQQVDSARVLNQLQLMLLAVGRAECALRSAEEKIAVRRLRETWSNALTAFLD